MIPKALHLSSNTKSRVEGISGGLILRCQGRNSSLRSKTRRLASRSLSYTTDVDQLVADGVGDDVWVQSIFLALGDSWINWEEGAFGGFAAGSSERE